MLGGLPGIIDGPIVRSVLSSTLDTSDGVVVQSGGRVRMETDQHHAFTGGWAVTRNGKAGRWVVLQPEVREGLASTMAELLGPVSGGPPSVNEPIWQAVCGGRIPSELHVLSLGRIERKVWVAHDGDGEVFAEVVFDKARSLGTHEVVSELTIRFGPANNGLCRRVAQALNDLSVAENTIDVRVAEPSADSESSLDWPLDRVVASMVALADRLDGHRLDGRDVSTQQGDRRSRKVLMNDIRSFLDTADLVQAVSERRMPLGLSAPLLAVLTYGQQLGYSEAWVALANNVESSEFERWAKAERRRFRDLFAGALRSLVANGVVADITAFAEMVAYLSPSEIEASLSSQLEIARNVIVLTGQKWKHNHHGAKHSLADVVVSVRRLNFAKNLIRLSDVDVTMPRLVKLSERLYAYEVGFGLLKERLLDSHASAQVVFDAARAIERDEVRLRKLTKRLAKLLDRYRVQLATPTIR